MYLPRTIISHLYQHLVRTRHALSPPVLLLVALEPDALCACRILTALLKRDYIPHKIQPISGYGDLHRAAVDLVVPMRTDEGGSGGVVICLGVGGLVDLDDTFFGNKSDPGDVEVWLMDARRPWNLSNVFGTSLYDETGALVAQTGVERGEIKYNYKPGKGGIIVFDDGDIEEELDAERNAHCGYFDLPPEVQEYDEEEDPEGYLDADGDDDEEEDAEHSDSEDAPQSGQSRKKRKSPVMSSDDDTEDELDDGGRTKRRRSNSGSSVALSPDRRPRRRGLFSTSTRLGGSSDLSRSDSPGSGSESPEPRRERSALAVQRQQFRQLLAEKKKYKSILAGYENLGQSYSEPVSSLVYSLASELGREDNDLLWNAIIGVSSLELYGRTAHGVGLNPLSAAGGSAGWNGDRGERIRSVFRDEVRRLNPTDLKDIAREASMGDSTGVIPTHARSPTDMSIRLSPEPRFLLIRHWSLYDSMLHSPYLSARLHIWSDAGRRRLHKLLAKMGVSLSQCKQSYTHMDTNIKRGLRERLLKYAPVYGLDGLVPPPPRSGDLKDGWGFVRFWGWKACLSAVDACVILGAILEVGDAKSLTSTTDNFASQQTSSSSQSQQHPDGGTTDIPDPATAQEHITSRFWTAYDALSSIDLLTAHIPTAQHLHRAILRTGTSLIEKRQIRHLRAFRMAVVKEGPDVTLFTHPGALTKLALWIAEAVVELSSGVKGKRKGGELVMAGLDEARGVYIVVGLGGGGAVITARERIERRENRRKEKDRKNKEKRKEKEKRRQKRLERARAAGLEDDELADSSESDEDDSNASDASASDTDSESSDVETEQAARAYGKNRFGIAFQQVARQTGARIRQDAFEACVVEIRKEDLSGFLERLSLEAVVG